MDYCDSGDVQQLIRSRKARGVKFSELQVKIWLVQLLSAVDFLHYWKVLHRDIKVRCHTKYHDALAVLMLENK